MASQTNSREFIFLSVGVALVCFVLAPAGTFDPRTYFATANDSERGYPIAPISVSEIAHTKGLDPVLDAVSRQAGTRSENQKIADLYGIDLYPSKAVIKAVDSRMTAKPQQDVHMPTLDTAPSAELTADTAEEPLVSDEPVDVSTTGVGGFLPIPRPVMLSREMPLAPVLSDAVSDIEDQIHVIAPGDSLDVILKRADIFANERYAITTAIARKFDLGHLRPGNKVRVVKNQSGDVSEVGIWVSENKIIEAIFGQATSVKTVNANNARPWPK